MISFELAWPITAAVLAAFSVWIGVVHNATYLGILIDERGKMSLSRLQMALWTWLLVSAFFAVAISHSTMNIKLPSEIWALMGLSVGSGAISVMIKGNKANQPPALPPAVPVAVLPPPVPAPGLGPPIPAPPAPLPPAAVAVPIAPPLPPNTALRGALVVNMSAAQAQFADLFAGEERPNVYYVDINKVQMFFFTIATVVGYALIIHGWPFKPDPKDGVFTFPPFNDSLVTLLGISHAGYLAVKAAPK